MLRAPERVGRVALHIIRLNRLERREPFQSSKKVRGVQARSGVLTQPNEVPIEGLRVADREILEDGFQSQRARQASRGRPQGAQSTKRGPSQGDRQCGPYSGLRPVGQIAKGITPERLVATVARE